VKLAAKVGLGLAIGAIGGWLLIEAVRVLVRTFT
jgi:hypothetical protein